MDVKGILIDLDGVMYTGDRVIPRAADALEYLKKKGYPIRYTLQTPREKTGRLFKGVFRNLALTSIPVKFSLLPLRRLHSCRD